VYRNARGHAIFDTKYLLRMHRRMLKRAYWDFAVALRDAPPRSSDGQTSLDSWDLARAFLTGIYLQTTDEVLKLFASARPR
jgi:hypothetical protein